MAVTPDKTKRRARWPASRPEVSRSEVETRIPEEEVSQRRDQTEQNKLTCAALKRVLLTLLRQLEGGPHNTHRKFLSEGGQRGKKRAWHTGKRRQLNPTFVEPELSTLDKATTSPVQSLAALRKSEFKITRRAARGA